LNPSEGPAFEPLISREARSLVPSRRRILFGVSPFPGLCCKREKEEKEKDTKSNDAAYLFCRRVPQPRWVGARPSAKGEKKAAGGGRERGGNPAAFVFVPRPGRTACSRGLQASTRERERAASRQPIWAGARDDISLVGPGTPRSRNANNYVNGNMENHPGKQCYHKGGMGRPWLINLES
jgi:hypothetical protein